MAVHVAFPAKLLMLATTVLSTLVSFIGGLLMYLEGLRIIEITVGDISRVELLSTAGQLNASFAATYETSLAYAMLLTTWEGFSTPREWQRYLRADQFGRAVAAKEILGTGVFSVPVDPTDGGGFAQMVYWDPLADGSRDWISADYFPEYWGTCVSPSRNDTAKHRCMVAYSLDARNGTVTSHAYNWSDNVMHEMGNGGRWERQQKGWEEHGALWWRSVDVWQSKDDTPYIFGSLVRTIKKQRPSHPIWGEGYKLAILVWHTFYRWDIELRRTPTQATLVAAFLNDGLNSQAIATNTGTPLMENCAKHTTAAGVNPCLITIEELRADMREACIKANATEAGRFIRTSIGGSEHWVMRQVVLATKRGYDEMPSIHLVWLRRVSTVEDKLNRALFFFISFVAVVFLFDVCVLIVEVRHIARPLEQLEWAMQPVDQMDLARSSERLQGAASGSCLEVSEVARLVRRFQLTLDALTTYKAYLPQSCLHQDNDADAEESVPTSAGDRETPAGSHRGSIPPTPEGRISVQSAELRDRARRASGRSPAQQDIIGAQTAEPRYTTVTLLAANSHGLLGAAFKGGPRSAAELVGVGVGRFAAAVKQHKGNVDLVSGDHHFASFGAVHRCPSHRMAGLSCAWALRAERGRLRSSVAVCSGEAFCGDFGDHAMMRFMVVGGLFCALLALERLAAQRAIDVLIDSKVHQDAVTWSCRLLDRVLHPKLPTGPFCIWSVVARLHADKGEEWMYELTQSKDPYEGHNAVLTFILKGEPGSARAVLATLSAGPSPAHQPADNRVDMSQTLPVGSQEAFALEEAIQALRERLASGDVPQEGRPTHLLLQEGFQTRVEEDSSHGQLPVAPPPRATAFARIAPDPLP